MKEFFVMVGALNIVVLLILVFFVLSKVRGVKYTIQRIKRVLRTEVHQNPFDSIVVFNNLLKKLGFEDKPIDPMSKSKFILCFYNRANKKNAMYRVLTMTDRRDIAQINDILKLIQDFTPNPFAYYLREYRIVPPWVDLHNEALRYIDPYDPTLNDEWKQYIIQEAKTNQLYYVEMVMSCPVGPIGEFIINLSDMIDNKKTETVTEKFTRQLKEEIDVEMSLDVAEKFNVGEINTIVAKAKEAGIKEITEDIAYTLLGQSIYCKDQEFIGLTDEKLQTKVSVDIKIAELLSSEELNKLLKAAIYYKIYKVDKDNINKIICGDNINDYDPNLIEANAIKLIIQGYIENVPAPIGEKYKELLENSKRTLDDIVFDEESWEAFDHNTKIWLANTPKAIRKGKLSLIECNELLKENHKLSNKTNKSNNKDQGKAQYMDFIGMDEKGLVRKVFIESGIVDRLDSNTRSKLIDAAIYYKIERVDRMTMDEVICGNSVDDFDLNLIEVNAIKLIIQGHNERIPAPIAINGSYNDLLENHKRTIGRIVFDEESWEGFDHNTKVWLASTAVAREEYYMNPSLAALLLKEREDRKSESDDKSDDKKATPKSGSKVKTPEKKIKVEVDDIEKEHNSEKIITD